MNKFENINKSSDLITMNSEVPITPQAVVQHIFSTTSCYDLMQNSSKGTVFETTIPFQLAFFALIEHDTDVAPLWDPSTRTFVGLMTVQDYIRAVRLCSRYNLNPLDITSQTIADMINKTPFVFHNQGFQSIDAEDSVLQLCFLFLRSKNDYVPLVDPESGNLVSILGPLDVVYLLSEIAKANESLFNITIQQSQVGTFKDVFIVNKGALIHEVLDALEDRDLSAAPIVDDAGKLLGSYHKSDVSFVMKAPGPDAVISNLRSFRVENSLSLREQLLQSGEIMSSFQGLVTCRLSDNLLAVFQAMIVGRAHRVIIINDQSQCCGVISFKDLIQFYLEQTNH